MKISSKFYLKITAVLVVILLVVGYTIVSSKNSSKIENNITVEKLDALLLADLQHQQIDIEPASKEIMDCSNISESEIRQLFNFKNINYSKCEPGNCHTTAYTIEGNLQNGNPVSFKLDCAEEGNVLREFKINGKADCI